MPVHFDGSPEERLALDSFVKLTRAAEAVGLRINGHLHDHQLTVSQFGVLEALFHLGPLQPSELGQKILKSNANMTVVIDNLEKRGLVERRRQDEDRRCIDVTLTASGRSLIERIFPGHVAGAVEALSVLSAKEQSLLGTLCRKLGLAQTEQDSTSTRAKHA